MARKFQEKRSENAKKRVVARRRVAQKNDFAVYFGGLYLSRITLIFTQAPYHRRKKFLHFSRFQKRSFSHSAFKKGPKMPAERDSGAPAFPIEERAGGPFWSPENRAPGAGTLFAKTNPRGLLRFRASFVRVCGGMTIVVTEGSGSRWG